MPGSRTEFLAVGGVQSDPAGTGVLMQIDKDQIIELLKSQGDHDEAQQADSEFPGKVDTDQDAGLLSTFGIDPMDPVKKLAGGGGLGGLLGH